MMSRIWSHSKVSWTRLLYRRRRIDSVIEEISLIFLVLTSTSLNTSKILLTE